MIHPENLETALDVLSRLDYLLSLYECTPTSLPHLIVSNNNGPEKYHLAMEFEDEGKADKAELQKLLDKEAKESHFTFSLESYIVDNEDYDYGYEVVEGTRVEISVSL